MSQVLRDEGALSPGSAAWSITFCLPAVSSCRCVVQLVLGAVTLEVRCGARVYLRGSRQCSLLASASRVWVVLGLPELLCFEGSGGPHSVNSDQRVGVHPHKDVPILSPQLSPQLRLEINCPGEKVTTLDQLSKPLLPGRCSGVRAGSGLPQRASQLWGWSYTIRACSLKLTLLREKPGRRAS